MRTILTNAFSLGMLSEFPAQILIDELSVDEAREIVRKGVESSVGHQDTAVLFGDFLGVPVPVNRVSVILGRGEALLVGQYRGPRLPEGCKALPDGATIVWLRITIR